MEPIEIVEESGDLFGETLSYNICHQFKVHMKLEKAIHFMFHTVSASHCHQQRSSRWGACAPPPPIFWGYSTV